MSKTATLAATTGLLSTRTDQLPAHITFDEYQRLRQDIQDNWLRRRKKTPRGEFYQRRALLFVDLLWATGARVDGWLPSQYQRIVSPETGDKSGDLPRGPRGAW